MKKEFNMPAANTYMSGKNEKEIISLGGGSILDMIKVGAQYLAPQYKHVTISFSYDYGNDRVVIKPEDKKPGMTATDLYVAICHERTGELPKWIFDSFIQRKITNDKIQVELEKAETKRDAEDIYEIALHAALLSRKNDGKTIELILNGKKLKINGDTPPEKVLARFMPKKPALRP